MATLTDSLVKFAGAHGASGYEDTVRALIIREFQKLTDTVDITPLGSVIGVKRAGGTRARRPSRRASATNAPRLLVEAHMDEIGLVVTEIRDGFIRFEEIGYWDPRVLPSQNVWVHGRKTLPGVIGSRPPHVLTAKERKHALTLDDLFIDVGMTDARARELVSPGDMITLDRAVIPLQNEMCAGKAFDNRASVVALLEFLKQLQNSAPAWDIYAVANVNEEDSPFYVGAQTAAYAIQPQLALCLDVTHAQQAGLNDEALPQTGQGPCIARGANIHPVVFEKLRQTAQRHALSHQITVYGGDTETNAWMMQTTGNGIPTGLVEIPLRYMHSAVETLALSDVQGAAKLLSAFAMNLNAADARALQGETFTRKAARQKRGARKNAARRAQRQR